MKAHAGHVIASGLLATYLGEDAGRRVHAGSIMRGSVDNLHAVLWYADIRGFTSISDSAPGPVVVELLNDVFEILTASLRERGGQVLKFIGDGMLAIFPFDEADRAETCRRALDAAIEAMRNIEALNAAREARGAPVADRSISRSISGTRCTATSARSTGSISQSLVRRSTRSARIEALVRAARARGAGLRRVRRRNGGPRQPAYLTWPPRFARRQGAEGDLRAGFARRG